MPRKRLVFLALALAVSACSGDPQTSYRPKNKEVSSSLVQSSINQTIMELMTFSLKLKEDLKHDEEYYEEPLIDALYLEHARDRVDTLADQLVGYDATKSMSKAQEGMYGITKDLRELIDEIEAWQEDYPEDGEDRFSEFTFRLDEIYSDLTGYFGLSK